MKFRSGLLIFGALLPLASAQVHEWTVTNGDVSRYLFSMERRDWTPDDAAAVLNRLAPRGVQHITIRDSQLSRGVLPWRGSASHGSAEGLRRMVFHERASRIPVSNIIRIRNAAVIRHRDASGAIHRKVIGPSDPLRLEISGVEVEILDIVFRAGSSMKTRHVRTPTPGYDVLIDRNLTLTFADDESALVFVTVNKNFLPLDLARSITTAVLGELKIAAGDVSLRPDLWFYDRLFSDALPFQPDHGTPPPVSYHIDHPTIRCSYSAELPSHVCRYEKPQ